MPDLEGITYSDVTPALREALLPVARQSFDETFRELYDREVFEKFLDQVYSPGGPMHADLKDPAIVWRVACAHGEPIGYAKLRALKAPAPNPLPGALELQQIYVLRQWHGTGVAQQLMNWAIDAACSRSAPELYLTVFSHNERAKRFYARNGFEEVGRCTFQIGDQIDDDRVWRKPLT
jgi:diamine N-acetyltransferase